VEEDEDNESEEEEDPMKRVSDLEESSEDEVDKEVLGDERNPVTKKVKRKSRDEDEDELPANKKNKKKDGYIELSVEKPVKELSFLEKRAQRKREVQQADADERAKVRSLGFIWIHYLKDINCFIVIKMFIFRKLIIYDKEGVLYFRFGFL